MADDEIKALEQLWGNRMLKANVPNPNGDVFTEEALSSMFSENNQELDADVTQALHVPPTQHVDIASVPLSAIWDTPEQRLEASEGSAVPVVSEELVDLFMNREAREALESSSPSPGTWDNLPRVSMGFRGGSRTAGTIVSRRTSEGFRPVASTRPAGISAPTPETPPAPVPIPTTHNLYHLLVEDD